MQASWLFQQKSYLMNDDKKIDSIFHYTNEEGLRGIITSKTLWATDFRWLNDNEELKSAKRLIFSWLQPQVSIWGGILHEKAKNDKDYQVMLQKHDGDRKKIIDNATQHLAWSLNNVLENYKIFITSFCNHGKAGSFAYKHGYLSMWRAYGGKKAYAIEMDYKKIHEMFKTETKIIHVDYPYFDAVEYCFSDQLCTIEQRFAKHQEHINDIVIGILTEGYDWRFTNEQMYHLLDLFINVKHEGFAEEREVRAAFALTANYAQNAKDAAKNGEALKPEKRVHCDNIPRIHFFEGLKSKLPITRIIVGPHENKHRHADELQYWLQYHKFDIPVTISDIPFRGMQ